MHVQIQRQNSVPRYRGSTYASKTTREGSANRTQVSPDGRRGNGGSRDSRDQKPSIGAGVYPLSSNHVWHGHYCDYY